MRIKNDLNFDKIQIEDQRHDRLSFVFVLIEENPRKMISQKQIFLRLIIRKFLHSIVEQANRIADESFYEFSS